MAAPSYDIITIGGGIAASSLAKAMAERGARVLVLEREKQFKDRVRGEAVVSWGVAEANALAICSLLKETCAHEVPYVEPGSGLRDLRATTLQQLPLLSFPHEVMQETLLVAVERVGAEVRGGVSVEHIECEAKPAVVLKMDTATSEFQPVSWLPLTVAALQHENGLVFQFANKTTTTTWPACC